MVLGYGDIMISKFEYSKCFINKDEILICPICHTRLSYLDHSLICKNRHTYNISKKGVSTLISHNHIKESKIYDYELFLNRRNLIQKMFYKKLYDKIVNIIVKNFNGKINILDLGCGEGTHTMNILNNLKQDYMYYGFDYAKVAIDMASDYNFKNRFYFISDVNNIPIKDNSIDLIIDILSPYNHLEIKRVLKKDGIFIKVVPGKNYLKELRNAIKLGSYNNASEVEKNLRKYFKVVQKESILTTHQITNEDFMLLLKMSPMHSKKTFNMSKVITIDLNIYIVDGKNY